MNKFEKKLDEALKENNANTTIGELNRARSILVGTAFGGTTEVSMRANDGRCIFTLLQPVETIELIHQLAANVGCHIALKPRDDFSSWREWRIPEAEKKHLNNFPPFPNDMAVFQRLGASGFDQEKAEAIMNTWLQMKEYVEGEGGGGKGGELEKNGDVPGGGGANTLDFLIEKFSSINKQTEEEKTQKEKSHGNALAAKKPRKQSKS